MLFITVYIYFNNMIRCITMLVFEEAPRITCPFKVLQEFKT